MGEKVEGETPLVAFKVRHRAGMTIAHQIAHFSSPFRGGLSLHSDPCGKAVESAKKPTAKNSRPQMALRPRGASREDAHNPISPIRSTGRLPPRSTVPDEETPGSNHRKTGPPTSWMVQWIPFQKEGYNEGTETGL